VVEAQGLSAHAINISLQRLRDSHARVFGAVLTKLRRNKSDGYGYGYGYGYGLKYGAEADT
jgi:succinoglycan biosynthesis transport protein ExoP